MLTMNLELEIIHLERICRPLPRCVMITVLIFIKNKIKKYIKMNNFLEQTTWSGQEITITLLVAVVQRPWQRYAHDVFGVPPATSNGRYPWRTLTLSATAERRQQHSGQGGKNEHPPKWRGQRVKQGRRVAYRAGTMTSKPQSKNCC